MSATTDDEYMTMAGIVIIMNDVNLTLRPFECEWNVCIMSSQSLYFPKVLQNAISATDIRILGGFLLKCLSRLERMLTLLYGAQKYHI